MTLRTTASVTVKLRGGPFDGQSAVAFGAVVGGLIEVNHRSYRVTSIDTIPGWREQVGKATFVAKPKGTPAGFVEKSTPIK